MSDLIDRQAAIDALERYKINDPMYGLDENEQGWNEGLDTAIELLKELPSAQPEIIRCEDCKWYGRADKRRFYRGMDCLQHRIDTIIPDKDFCSRAERRTDEID